MIGSLNMLSGVKVIEDMHLPIYHDRPNKKHKWRFSKSKFYNNRIQKKWNKRFGFTRELFFIRSHGNLFAHPSNIQRLKEATNEINTSIKSNFI